MNKIIEWLSKTKIFIFSLVASGLFFAMFSTNTLNKLCKSDLCIDVFNYTTLLFMFFVGVLLASFFILFVKVGVKDIWVKYTVYYYLVYILLISIVPWNFGDVYLPLYKENIALVLCILYFLISLILIITKSIQLKNSNKIT